MAAISNGTGTFALAAFSDNKPMKLSKTEFGRPAPGPMDIDINVAFCGMCHSDLHTVQGDWGEKKYPFTPGHEIAGTVTSVGDKVTKFSVGDRVGVGCMVESCRGCSSCKAGLEQHCTSGPVMTYGSAFAKTHPRYDGGELTRGGYSDRIVVDEHFVFRVPDGLKLEEAGPLCCAGITTYSPLARHVKGKEGQSVGVLGFGGLGHMAAKIAKGMGAEVVIMSRSLKKAEEAKALGCKLVSHADEDVMSSMARKFDVVIDTVPAQHDVQKIMLTLAVGGALVVVGAGSGATEIQPVQMLANRWGIEGSLIGGCQETEEMLEFCAKNSIKPEIEIIGCKDATAAFQKLSSGDVAKRHVIDMSTIGDM